jgi:hypothetical protein
VVDLVAQDKGSFFNKDGVKTYEGDWRDHCRQGQGTEFHHVTGHKVYQGDFLNNIKHGQGKMWTKSGKMYQGQFSNGKMNGEGTLYWRERGPKYYQG